VGAELVVVVGQEEAGLRDEVFVAGVFERLGSTPIEVAEVGGGVELDAVLGDVLVEAEDHAFVLARLQTGVLLDGAAADGGENHAVDVGGRGGVPRLELDNKAVVVLAVAAGQEDVDA